MPVPTNLADPTFQAQFHRRWNHLNDPHVRTLAWLLDAPDLLDLNAPSWQGRVATLGPVAEATRDWLATLDKAPAELHAHLDLSPLTRLGRYAEKLMAFYLERQGLLYAHGVQVRAGKSETIGEFDFLIREKNALIHWEFATKLYLLGADGHEQQADYFVGPNLADTLGAKIRKIMDQQLSLSQHPAAQAHLPQPVSAAQALVKGWLFYHGQTPSPVQPSWISHTHCRGFWCALEDLEHLKAKRYAVLPRLQWLAPAKLAYAQTFDLGALKNQLSSCFMDNTAPALIALLKPEGESMLECDRGFIVQNDWHRRAEARIKSVS